MSARDEAMRAAVENTYAALSHDLAAMPTSLEAATAGADAELARVVAYIWDESYRTGGAISLPALANAIEARAHWPTDA